MMNEATIQQVAGIIDGLRSDVNGLLDTPKGPYELDEETTRQLIVILKASENIILHLKRQVLK